MKTKKNIKLFLQLLFLVLIMQVGCKTEITIGDYFDKNLSLTLKRTFRNENSSLSTTDTKQISPNSDKFLRLTKWCNDNKIGWEETYASFISELSITQNSFRLLVLNEAVVVGFTDKEGKAKQYSKAIKKDDLNFMIN
jgi:hypothetical protein